LVLASRSSTFLGILDAEDVVNTALPWERARRPAAARVPHFVLAWSLDEPDRIGEVVPVTKAHAIGRGGPLDDDPAPRSALHQMATSPDRG
jgi:hypothetical protein